MKFNRAGDGCRPRYPRASGHAFLSVAPRRALNGQQSRRALAQVTSAFPQLSFTARKNFQASTADDARATASDKKRGQRPAETQIRHAPDDRTDGASSGRYRGGSNSSGAWAIVGVLLLTLVMMSSLTVRPRSVTNEDIARAAHHMPHDRGHLGRN